MSLKLFPIFAISGLVLAGCTTTQPVNQNLDNGTSLPVPAPNNQGVPEMSVNEGDEAEDDGPSVTLPPVQTVNQDPDLSTNNDNTTELPEPGSSTLSVKSFDLTARQWEFTPDTVTVNEGDTVKLSIASVDVDHGFALTQFGVNERLRPGETVNIEFVADKKGTFSFFCSVFCGQGHSGMRGTLIVN